MEHLEKCLCCGGNNFQLYLEAQDNYSGEKFKIDQCKDCGFIFTNPRPDINEIGRYYNSPDYMSHGSHSKGFVPAVYRYARKYMMRKKLSMIREIIGKATDFSLLDYGCGTGDFLGYVKQQGIFAEGVELDEHAREVAKNVNHVDTYSIESSVNIPKEKFDVITMWHVLEHIHDLHNQIDHFYSWLKPGGKILIAVPNIESFDAKKYGAQWDALDVPRHIYHYSPKNMKQIIGQHNFNFEKQLPLFLDAYYVSMRSEWHQGTGKMLAYFKAMLSGFQSNLEASETGQYSSLIYVFTKI